MLDNSWMASREIESTAPQIPVNDAQGHAYYISWYSSFCFYVLKCQVGSPVYFTRYVATKYITKNWTCFEVLPP